MKKILLIVLLLSSGYMGRAQLTFKNTGSGINDINRFIEPRDRISDDQYIKPVTNTDSPVQSTELQILDQVTMDVNDTAAFFENLPPKIIMIHIADGTGSPVASRSITHLKNWINIAEFPAGRYILTLTYKEKSKGFTIERY